MIILMIVNLYTVRVVLDVLGVEDYGIYGVIGSIVTMFSFLNGNLMSASQRFFSIEIANNNIKKLNKLFNLNISLFALLSVVVFIISESIGLWFINNQLVIPEDRISAANWVYQISIATFVVNLFTIPFNSLIVSYEKMKAFAYIAIIEALGKLGLVFFLSYLDADKLIVYALLMFIFSLLINITYFVYCKYSFKELKLFLYWNIKELKELINLIGWHFLGTLSLSLNSQGINILINMFFNPAINAARAIAFQVNSAANQLAVNFFTAVKPQIYKSYTTGDLDEMGRLVRRSIIFSMFLIGIITVPMIAKTELVLSLWLKEVPLYTIIFTKLTLINAMIDTTAGPIIAVSLATGRIKQFQIVVSVISLLNLPISYILLRHGASPESTIIISIICSVINMFVRTYMLNKEMEIKLSQYYILYVKLLLYIILSVLISVYIGSYIIDNIMGVIFIGIISLLVQTILTYIIIDSSDRKYLMNLIKTKVNYNK